ncbi:unnamed protein product [Sphagnum balticum]
MEQQAQANHIVITWPQAPKASYPPTPVSPSPTSSQSPTTTVVKPGKTNSASNAHKDTPSVSKEYAARSAPSAVNSTPPWEYARPATRDTEWSMAPANSIAKTQDAHSGMAIPALSALKDGISMDKVYVSPSAINATFGLAQVTAPNATPDTSSPTPEIALSTPLPSVAPLTLSALSGTEPSASSAPSEHTTMTLSDSVRPSPISAKPGTKMMVRASPATLDTTSDVDSGIGPTKNAYNAQLIGSSTASNPAFQCLINAKHSDRMEPALPAMWDTAYKLTGNASRIPPKTSPIWDALYGTGLTKDVSNARPIGSLIVTTTALSFLINARPLITTETASLATLDTTLHRMDHASSRLPKTLLI